MTSLLTTDAATMTQPNTKDTLGSASGPSTQTRLTGPPSPLKPIFSPPASWSRSAMLRKCAHAFVMALASPEFDPHTFLRTFMTTGSCRITHHGPRWGTKRLPYLSGGDGEREFVGRDGCLKYLELVGNTFKARFYNDAFPPDEQLCVDAEAVVPGTELTGRVCLDGKGKFTNHETGWQWTEVFMYRLSGFDEDGRVEHWEIWTDTLSAWEAAAEKKTNTT